jgi:hypothetical protein
MLKSILLVFLLIFAVSGLYILPDQAIAAFPTEWQRKCKLTIQNGKIDAALVYFPVLITQTTLPQGANEIFDADGTHPAQTGGGDIRFSSDSAGSSQLACEIVTFTTDNDPSNGVAEIWVEVPSIASGSDTDIYIWWETSASDSQPAEDATYGKEDTWDDGGNDYFKVVLHLNEDPSPNGVQAIDSTAYDEDGTTSGTMTSGDLVTGLFAGGTQGKSWDFDGTDDVVASTYNSQPTDFTASGWFKQQGTPSSGYIRVLDKNYAAGMWIGRGNDSHTWGGGVLESSSPYGRYVTLTDGNIHHIASRRDGTTHTIIGDGGAVTTSGTVSGDALDTTVLRIADSVGGTDDFEGPIDEIRFSATARSNAWIKAEYENGSDPNAFIVEGTPEAIAAAIPEGGIGSGVGRGIGGGILGSLMTFPIIGAIRNPELNRREL